MHRSLATRHLLRRKLEEAEFRTVLWLFPLALTLHMVEEMLWLPAWSKDAGAWHIPVEAGQFAVASLLLIALGFLLTYASYRAGRESLPLYVTLALGLVLVFNVAYPHLGGTLAQGRYVPGLATAILFNLPVNLYLLQRAFREHSVSPKRFVLAAVPVIVSAVLGWQALFVVGARVAEFLG